MLREDLSHSEQIIADYGWVSGHKKGYADGWNDSQHLAVRDKKICILLGVALGVLTSRMIDVVIDVWEDCDVPEKAKAWASEKREKIKSKFTKKNKKH